MHLLTRLATMCLAYPMRVALAVTCLAGLGAAQLALPWVIKSWVEGPLVDGNQTGARWVAVALAVTAMISLFLFLSRTLLADINQRLVEDLRGQAVDRLLEQEPSQLTRFTTGDLMARVLQDAGMLSGFAEILLKRLIGDGLLMTGALTMMFVLNPRLAAVAFVLAPLVALVMRSVGATIRHWGQVAQQEMGSLSATLQEQLQGFTTVKGYTNEGYESRRFADHNAGYRRKVVRAQTWSALLIAAVFLFATLGFVAAIAFGTSQVTAGALSAGSLLAFCLYAGQMIEPLRRLAEMHGILQRSLAAAERITTILDLPTGDSDDMSVGDDGPALQSGAEIEIDGVHFAYLSDHPVLDDLRFRIEAGERVAIVGESGSGKSTLAALLIRFREPDAGHILLDGADIAAWPRATLRRQVRVVEQKPFVFRGSIAANIRYGSWDAPITAVEEAIRLTGLTSVIADDTRGADTPVAEAGRDISGGQQQRLALARAIVSDPAVLVLDEATSALDSESEAHILRDLEPWLARRTVIVMAHRLSTIRRVPRIIVLQAGRIAADGSLEELMRTSPDFRTLFAAQFDDPGTCDHAAADPK